MSGRPLQQRAADAADLLWQLARNELNLREEERRGDPGNPLNPRPAQHTAAAAAYTRAAQLVQGVVLRGDDPVDRLDRPDGAPR